MAARPSLYVWQNPDKPDEPDTEEKRAADPFQPAPPGAWRWAIFGPPNAGKRSLALSVIWRIPKRPKRAIVVHLDPACTEWDVLSELGCPVEVFEPKSPDLPDFSSISRDDRCLLVIDEVAFKELPRGAKETLTRLFSYGSSHKGIMVLLMYQDPSRTTPEVRRACNIVTLFRMADRELLDGLARRLGVLSAELAELREFLRDPHDSVTIRLDEAPDSPLRYTLNWYEPIWRTPAGGAGRV